MQPTIPETHYCFTPRRSKVSVRTRQTKRLASSSERVEGFTNHYIGFACEPLENFTPPRFSGKLLELELSS